MCGIVGYVGRRTAQPILLDGLRRLEYRGYDSAGLATVNNGRVHLCKQPGRIADLEAMLADAPLPGSLGIGHTRWATHGRVSTQNAHPHLDGPCRLAVVHNGVIENHAALREMLEQHGTEFRSETDSEVIAHLIRHQLDAGARKANGDPVAGLLAAVRAALGQLKGTYGLVIFSLDHPDMLIAARFGSPLVVGVGDGEHLLASDPSGLVHHASNVVYLKDKEIAMLRPDHLEIVNLDGAAVALDVREAPYAPEEAELGAFPHHMLKEIYEQPDAFENAIRGRLDDEEATARFGGLNLTPQQLRRVERVILTACGTSWHAGLVGEYLLEEFARLPVEVEYASELRYRNPPIDRNTIVFAITQSGETADTLAALRECKRKGHPTLAICNVVGSTIAREADGGIYLHAGPEIGVASTKAFTAQVAVLTLLALYLGRMRHLSYAAGRSIIEQLRGIPEVLRRTLEQDAACRAIAEKYCDADNFLYLGRHYNFPVALEGALKLKEISYIHAEGYPAAEMKHGPIALVDEKTPSVFLIPRGTVYDKVMSNLAEIRARGGPVIAVACEGDREVPRAADDVIYVPEVDDYLQPLVTVVPLQLLAYHFAVLRGCDVDKPRNLAKSVTVE